MSDESMMSSCTSAHACRNSSELTALSTASARAPVCSPPAPRHPHHANVGRIRLPPPSTKASSASTAVLKAGARLRRSPRRDRMYRASASSTLAATASSIAVVFVGSI
jgi:hypothetical protein